MIGRSRDHDITSKVRLHRTVLLFRLPVCLRLECGGESTFNTKEVAERGPELRHKNCSAITNDGVWEAVLSHHYVDNYFRQSGGINGDLDWLIMHYVCEPVNNY